MSIKETPTCKNATRCKGGVKWSDKTAALWESIQVKRSKSLNRDGTISQLRKIQRRRLEAMRKID